MIESTLMIDKPSLCEMGMYRSNTIMKRQFDFDIGYLQKSPCRDCLQRPLFPGCIDDCTMLEQIQTKLARGISTTHTHSPLEPFAVLLDSRQEK